MNITPDYLIERKRNKKHLGRWKIAVLVLIVLYVAKFGAPFLSGKSLNSKANLNLTSGDYIAAIEIKDLILDDSKRLRKISEIEKNKSVKAVIVKINSQGGSAVASEMLYNAVRKLSEAKPVVVVMGDVAASGGYMTALAGDYIVAHNGTITGSIGVIFQSAEVTELAKSLGIKFNNFKSSKFKASPNPTEKLTEEVREVTMETIHDVYDYFVELVAKRRNLNIEYVKTIADGRIYTGRQALKLKLIDAVGDEDTALEWLRSSKGVSKDLKLVDVRLKPRERLLDIIMNDLQSSISRFFSSSSSGVQAIM